MIELTTFGATELRRDGIDVRSVLSQPKRLALLVYLRVAAAGGFVPRDRLLALFWPESDQERARNALRQALHFLRRSLGEEALITRTERDIGVDEAAIACDAVAFRASLAAGRLEEAVERYRGEFLPGFFVEDAPEVERWIDEQRVELARLAAGAASTLSERAESAGELAAAVLWARRGLTIEPLDEHRVRRLMRLLDAAGQRAAALEAYQELARRLAQELEIEPVSETTGLAEQIRAGSTVARPAAPSVAAASSSAPARPVAASAVPAQPAEPGPAAVSSPSAVLSPASTPGDAPAAAPPAHAPVAAAETAAATPAHTGADTAASARRRRARFPLRALGPAVVVLLALAGWRVFARRPAPAPEAPPAVAVLPFLDMSDDGANAYFSDGISEELLNVLARVPGLRVAARTSSFAFRDSNVPIDSIARALNVTHVVEGSVRSAGNRVRITAQLIEAENGYHLWSENYDRELNDIFTVQDEISAEIAQRLQIELAGEFWGTSARETSDPEAYRLLLRALHTFRAPSQESYATSVNLLEHALRLDPDYARAYGALAHVLVWQAYFGWTPPEPAQARADSLARRGLAIAETPEAHLALAHLAEVRAWSPDSADSHFRRALELNPSDMRALQMRALFLARSNRGDEAVAGARRATELDPLHPGAWSNYAAVLSMLGREEEAVAALERARSVAPRDVIVLSNLAGQYSTVGRLDDAVATADAALAIDSTNLHLLGLRVHLLFQAGHTDAAMSRLAALERRPEFPRFRLAALYANTADVEHTLDLLEESAALHEDEISRIRSPDMFRGLRQHPRFVTLLRQLDSGTGQ